MEGEISDTPRKKSTPISDELAELIRTKQGNSFKSIETMAKSLERSDGRALGASYNEIKKSLNDLNDRLNSGEITVAGYLDETGIDDVKFAVLQNAIPSFWGEPGSPSVDVVDVEQDYEDYIQTVNKQMAAKRAEAESRKLHNKYMQAMDEHLAQMEAMVDIGPNNMTTIAPYQQPDVYVDNQEQISNDWSVVDDDDNPIPVYGEESEIVRWDYDDTGEQSIPVYGQEEEQEYFDVEDKSDDWPISQLMQPSFSELLSKSQSVSSKPVSQLLANSQSIGRKPISSVALGTPNNSMAGFTDDKLKRAKILGLDLSTPEGIAQYQRDRQQRATDAGAFKPNRASDDQWSVKKTYFSKNSMAPITRYT